VTLLFWLLAAHALCDYPLQGDFLARAKNHRAPVPGVPWYQALGAHALIHGGAVALVTGSVALGLAETLCHVAIDYAKCDGRLDYNEDQYLHAACKMTWVVLLSHGVIG
jgi:hypothetical protein